MAKLEQELIYTQIIKSIMYRSGCYSSVEQFSTPNSAGKWTITKDRITRKVEEFYFVTVTGTRINSYETNSTIVPKEVTMYGMLSHFSNSVPMTHQILEVMERRIASDTELLQIWGKAGFVKRNSIYGNELRSLAAPLPSSIKGAPYVGIKCTVGGRYVLMDAIEMGEYAKII